MKAKGSIFLKTAAALISSAALATPVMAAHGEVLSPAEITPDVTYTLRTAVQDGKLVFIGDKGRIKDIVNPDLHAPVGAVVQINLINGDGALHDIALPEFEVDSDDIGGQGSATAVAFRVDEEGNFEYLCSLPGHKAAGMVGNFIVGDPEPEEQAEAAQDLAKDPHDVGEPVGDRGPQEVTVDLESTEVEGYLADGSSYKYWTFNNTVPGPSYESA
ncbi:hypothetical protein HSBAA_26890 [Vreelandella sulfidaeris]|uniref:Blue (type 1) copper domain-containing protein n=1 Tax=Vreelandella sulfidaeris TaxID=115553 RepID=A0A455U851_9GAMM|nr:hypothetical protein HSBAA_26890 [Halomonas sulfidaeris]